MYHKHEQPVLRTKLYDFTLYFPLSYPWLVS